MEKKRKFVFEVVPDERTRTTLKMDPAQIRSFHLGMQELLYNSRGVVNLTIENHYHGNIDQLTINGN